MEQEFVQDYKVVKNIVFTTYVETLEKKIEQQVLLVKEMRSEITGFIEQPPFSGDRDPMKIVQQAELLKASLLKKTQERSHIPTEKHFDGQYADFLLALNDHLQQIPTTQVRIQKKERFQVEPEDGGLLRLGKRGKNILFEISLWPVKSGNVFRKLFGKPIKSARQWTHKIPLQNMAIYFLRDELSLALLPLSELVYQTVSVTSAKLWKLEELVDSWITRSVLQIKLDDNEPTPSSTDVALVENEFRELTDYLAQAKKQLKVAAEEAMEAVIQQFEESCDKTGTIERGAGRFHSIRIQKKHQQVQAACRKVSLNWRNTFQALNDGWELDRELYSLCYYSLRRYFQTKERVDHKVHQRIIPETEKLGDFLRLVRKELDSISKDKKTVRQTLLDKREFCQVRLRGELIPHLLDTLLSQNIPQDVFVIEADIKKRVGQISEKRKISKELVFDRVLNSSEVDVIPPKDLLLFETLPAFTKVTEHLKSETVKKIQKIQTQIQEFGQVVDFNLAAAVSAIEEGTNHKEDALEMATDGLGRALGKLEEIDQELEKLLQLIWDDLNTSVKAFCGKLLVLTDANNVLEVKIRLAKAKAIERSKAFRQRLLDYQRNLGPILVEKTRSVGRQLAARYQQAKKRYGIDSKPQDLTTEVSTFLARSQEALKKLPFVYQRLFDNIPLEEETFFEMRPMEMEKLELAFDNWKQGNYSPFLLIGETGAGATTLINVFLKGVVDKLELIKWNAGSRIYTPEALSVFFAEKLNWEKPADLDELVAHLKKLNRKRVIVLENLQHFFLRKVDGFGCLKMIFELIFRTQSNVFWIVTINQYSFDYLNKALSISDHFAYKVRMAELKEDQIRSIILKRHAVSGYKLEFLPAREDLENKKFQRLSEEEQQRYLENAYFTRLNKLASSNIGLALVYWLRSTSEVEGDKMTIISLKELDFSFLSGLSHQKVFTLHAILLHDGLTLEEHTIVFNQTLEESKLILMTLIEEGSIVRKEEKLWVNPLLYRPIVNWLKSKNLIH